MFEFFTQRFSLGNFIHPPLFKLSIYILLLLFVLSPNIYTQTLTAEKLYLDAIELIQKIVPANSKESDYKNAIEKLKQVINLDTEFIEAYFRIGKIYSSMTFGISNNSHHYNANSKLYYDKCIELIKSGFKLRNLDDLTERIIYREIAFSYNDVFMFNKDCNKEYFLYAIELYELSLSMPYKENDSIPSLIPDFYSDSELSKSIASCYIDLASIEKFEKNYSSAINYLYSAINNIKMLNIMILY